MLLDKFDTFNEKGGGRPAPGGNKGHLLVLRQQLMRQSAVPHRIGRSNSLESFNHAARGVIARGGGASRDPIGVPREEGEPIRRVAADDDVVDCLIEFPDTGVNEVIRSGARLFGLRCRRPVEVDLDELGVVGFAGAVAVVGD